MKRTIDLLNAVIALGFDKEKALEHIDECLDYELGYENRKDLGPNEEEISDQLYEDILWGFKVEKQENDFFKEYMSQRGGEENV